MSQNNAYIDQDLAHVWHPCSQMKDHEWLPLVPIRSGEGVWLEDFDGNRYLDAISSWWVNLFGHCHPYINARIKAQLDSLEHVILGGFTHEPVIELSRRLAEVTPGDLTRCFYADNGSSAVEIALKMSYHYWKNNDLPEKSTFVALGNSYHGETLGALAVGDVALYKETYAPLLMNVTIAKSPDCYGVPPEDWDTHVEQALDDMEAILAENHARIAGVIVEPLVQFAGGMRMYSPHYLSKLRTLCTQYGVHLIADEIAVGFGRSGTMFACEQADITPDFMCLSKGLTAGYLPLSTVVTNDKIYQAFYDDYATLKAFLHSHSFTGNPLGCSAALATLDLFERDNVIANNHILSQAMTEATAHLRDHPNVAEIRQTGMVLAIELVKNKATGEMYPWEDRIGIAVYQEALKRGALLRPLGNVIYFLPPYIITPEQIKWLADLATDCINAVCKA